MSAGSKEGEEGVAARGLSAVVFAGLVAVVPLSAVPYGSVEPHWTAVFEALVFLLAALWALEGALSGGWVSRAHTLALPGVALSAYALLQSLPGGGGAISYDPYETRLAAVELLAYAAFLALLLRYTDGERRLRALLYAVVSAGLASSLFGILRQTTHRGEGGFLLEYLRAGTGYAQFINKNHFAYLAEMALGVLLGLVAGRGVARAKALVPLALALPVWAALVLSNSRGAVFAMLCQIIFLGATFGVTRAPGRGDDDRDSRARTPRAPSFLDRAARSKAARGGLVAALLLTIIVGMVWLGGDALADRVASVGEEVAAADSTDATRTGRKDIWAATWEMFGAHALTGVGFGGYWTAVSLYHKGSGGSVPQQAHNDYLEVLASGGIVGAALVGLFLFLLVKGSLPRLREGSPFARAACLGALTGLCGVCVHSLVEFGLHVPSNALAAVALCAAAAARVKNGQKTNPSEY
ncbi:MAG TPA: O-antigen ligase family protein [Pyrinomonadaceae bacterium]|jgi:O-antigen ligase